MSEQIFRIRIANNKLEFEVQGTKEFVEEMLQKFDKFVFTIQGNIEEISISPINEDTKKEKVKELSVSEFIRKLNLKKHTDIVLAFAYYLEEFSGLNEFSPADINNCYYQAKMESSNTSQMLIQLIRRGHVMQAKAENTKGKKNFTITQSGIDCINKVLESIKI